MIAENLWWPTIPVSQCQSNGVWSAFKVVLWLGVIYFGNFLLKSPLLGCCCCQPGYVFCLVRFITFAKCCQLELVGILMLANVNKHQHFDLQCMPTWVSQRFDATKCKQALILFSIKMLANSSWPSAWIWPTGIHTVRMTIASQLATCAEHFQTRSIQVIIRFLSIVPCVDVGHFGVGRRPPGGEGGRRRPWAAVQRPWGDDRDARCRRSHRGARHPSGCRRREGGRELPARGIRRLPGCP